MWGIVPITLAESNKSYRIVKLLTDDKEREFLSSYNIIVDSVVVKDKEDKDSVTILVKDTKVVIGKSLAMKILVG